MEILKRLKKHDHLLMAITPLDCTLTWIDRIQNKLLLKAYTTQSWTNSECEKGMLFNPTSIKRCLQAFIKRYLVKNPTLACVISGPLISEHIQVGSPHIQIASTSRHWQWDSLYLCNYNDEPLFYSAGIPQTILLQYKLLSISTHIPLSLLTTQPMSVLKVYQHIKGNTFRTAQLSNDLYHANGLIEQLIDIHLLPRILTVPSHFSIAPEQYQSLLIATGLFLLATES